ncbi:UDP-glucuronosyltransferase 1-2-like isoform X1 [Lytechinus pictus]|uniref:UDP-glucuronosyltransferase 1-2-like isoform X1 n=1 Tax=Lytechinus pictus TaxID=7653 RepID=UPI0030B9CF29
MKLVTFTKFTLLTIAFTSLTNAANILVTVLVPEYTSHPKSMSAITGALSSRGHNVTILTCSFVGTEGFPRDTYNTALHYRFDVPSGYEGTLDTMIEDFFQKGPLSNMIDIGKLYSWIRLACQSLLEDSAVLFRLKESHFDILIGDVVDGCDAILSSYLGIPHIAVTTTTRYFLFHERLYGIPAPSSYVQYSLPLSDQMTFLERVASFMDHNLVSRFLGWVHFGALDEIKDAHGIAPGRSTQELVGDAELWMCMTSFAFDFPHPTAPNWVAIGNTVGVPARPLDKKYKEFIEGSGEHGFIIFSLGSYFTRVPLHMAEVFARVFSELPQRVIWRYIGPRPRHLGNNTLIVDWIPQNDILGHPKARLMIYHGGLRGILEAIYHAVPLVVMPVIFDQASNAVKVKTKGIGRILNRFYATDENVREVITDVLVNQSYRDNIIKYSRIYKDTQSDPEETIVYWVEHILKHGGSHLRSRALQLNFIQLNSIDVLAFIGAILLVTTFLVYSCCIRCPSRCLNSRKSKLE